VDRGGSIAEVERLDAFEHVSVDRRPERDDDREGLLLCGTGCGRRRRVRLTKRLAGEKLEELVAVVVATERWELDERSKACLVDELHVHVAVHHRVLHSAFRIPRVEDATGRATRGTEDRPPTSRCA
jgi:hypothetical protein